MGYGYQGRPGPAVPGLANLYVVGDWVGGEGLLLNASLASARQAAHLIIEATRTQEDPRPIAIELPAPVTVN